MADRLRIDWRLLATFAFSLISLSIWNTIVVVRCNCVSAQLLWRMALGVAVGTLIAGTPLWMAWTKFAPATPNDASAARLRRQSWGWVRLLFGLTLILLLIKTTRDELSGEVGPHMFRFSNSNQFTGGMIANAIMFVLELSLAWSGLRRIMDPPETLATPRDDTPPQP
jgi:hypothetical protein